MLKQFTQENLKYSYTNTLSKQLMHTLKSHCKHLQVALSIEHTEHLTTINKMHIQHTSKHRSIKKQ